MFALLEAAVKENRNLDFELISHFKASIEREHQVEFPMLHLLEDFLVRINKTAETLLPIKCSSGLAGSRWGP